MVAFIVFYMLCNSFYTGLTFFLNFGRTRQLKPSGPGAFVEVDSSEGGVLIMDSVLSALFGFPAFFLSQFW